MLDLTTNRGRLIDAALKLAERRPWQDVSLYDIAREAGLTLLDLKHAFTSKEAVLVALSQAVDEEVLHRIQLQDDTGEGARDRIFGVIMTRFDVLQPHRAALRSIHAGAGGQLHLALCAQVLSSQRWMLTGAAIDAEGPLGALKAAGLAGIYSRIFSVWLDDEDPGLAKTMAALDRALRRGEKPLEFVSEICGSLGRMANQFGRRRRGRGEPSTAPTEPIIGGAEPGPQPEAP